jgi:hypothetical protein
LLRRVKMTENAVRGKAIRNLSSFRRSFTRLLRGQLIQRNV